MSLRNTDTEYGSIARGFHWITAVLVIFMLLLGFLMGKASAGTLRSILYTLHKSTGLTLLFLMILRYLWRLSSKIPKFPAGTPIWQATAARWSHALLYLSVTLMPLSGWIFSTAAGHPPNFWWIVKMPAPWTAVNTTVKSIAGDIHRGLAWVVIALLCLHILGALSHLIIRRDQVVQSMLPQFLKKKRYYD